MAEFALNAGAALVNDVSGGLADPRMPRLVAAAGAPYVVVHWRGHSRDMYARAVYTDVVRRGPRRARPPGRRGGGGRGGPERIVVDPGLGFGKRPEHNWPLLAHLPDIALLGGRTFPILVGASGSGSSASCWPGRMAPEAVSGCDEATVAISALAAAAGAWCVRVHQVRPTPTRCG